MQATKNLYELLGLSKGASQEDIRREHRKLARKYHPDANPDDPQAEERFKEVQRAYEVLSDPKQRREYDQRLSASSRKGGAGRKGAGAAGADPSRPRPSSAGSRTGEATTYTVDLDLSELLAKLADLSSERTSGRTEGTFQLRGEEIAQLAKVLGEEVSRILELWGKDKAELLRLLNERLKRNANADSEEARSDGSSAPNETTSGGQAYGTSSRKPREKKVKGPRAQGRTKTVKGPRARRKRKEGEE
jgi:curved DNA-binding protein CbpA